LNKTDFNASSWFDNGSDSRKSHYSNNENDRIFHNSLADFSYKSEEGSSLNRFFVPGWKGESLVSKEVKEFNLTLKKIHYDVKNKFKSIPFLNSKLKFAIYNEFLSFAEFKAYNFTGIDSIEDFFSEIKNEDSAHKDKLDQFIDIYTFRTTVIFILKLRFISILVKKTDQKFDEKSLFYPNSFLTRVFRKGSSTELNSEALNQNVYSWYRPDEDLRFALKSFYEMSDSLSITQLIKNISIISEKTLAHEAEYSHSLSHKHFGLFLNSLLINYPIWLQKFNPRFKRSFRSSNSNLDIISSKYDGDYLESLSLSHWLAQEENRSVKWDQILCPSFQSGNFDAGLFTKVINELQFLTFLSQIAIEQGKKPISFICEVMKGHLENRKLSGLGQKDLFNDISSNRSTYDRLILNLAEHPKSNAQHYILNTVSKNINTIKDNGLIFVISSKKIFIPSQKTKIESFLNKFNLESVFDFSSIEGKGEVGNYIYIFSKNLKSNSNEDKKSFLNFRLSGNLNTFQEFEKVTKLTQDFFVSNFKDIPSISAKEMGGFNFEFFQDAIVSGKMIHASTRDSSKITHPHFFNNLMKSCTTFDNFFEIKPIKTQDNEFFDDGLGLSQKKYLAPHIAIIDMRNRNETKIEITSSSTLEAKIETYGKSLCFYFEINSKWPGLDIESVKAFLNSTIGVQLIDLTFNNQLRRAKSNFNKLLLPKFLIQSKEIPEHISSALKSLSYSSEQILETHPQELQKQFKDLSMLLTDLANDYPEQVISKVSSFKKSISACLRLFDFAQRKSVLNFNNPILKTPLLLSKTTPIYPNNEDIFLDFNNETSAKIIHSPLTSFKTVSSINEGLKTYRIDLYSGELKVLSLYSDIEMIQFLEYLFSNVIGASISQVIQGIKVPELENLKSIIESFNQMQTSLFELDSELKPYLNLLISKSINKAY